MNKEFIKVRTATDIAISSSLFVLGILLIVLPAPASARFCGFLLLIVCAALLAILKTGWQDPKTKERYCKREIFFPRGCKAEVLDALENHMLNVDVAVEAKGEGLMMEIYYSKQSRKAFLSLFEYVPYSYKPVSPTFEYTIDEVTKLLG